MKDLKLRYFKSVKGHVVPRYGTDTMIGVVRFGNRWEWDLDKITAIPEDEIKRSGKAYRRALRDGSIVEVDAPTLAAPKPLETKEEIKDETPKGDTFGGTVESKSKKRGKKRTKTEEVNK